MSRFQFNPFTKKLDFADANPGETNVTFLQGDTGLAAPPNSSGVEFVLGSATIATVSDPTTHSVVSSVLPAGIDKNTLGGSSLTVINGGTGASSASGARTNLGLAIGTNVEAHSADLDAYAALATTGFVARTGSGTVATRSLTSADASVTITNAAGVAGDPSLTVNPSGIDINTLTGYPLTIAHGGTNAITASAARTSLGLAIGTNVEAHSADLDAYAALATTGFVSRTGSGTVATRTLSSGNSLMTVLNGDGLAGNCSFTINQANFNINSLTGGPLTVPNGGTAATSLSGLVYGNAASAMTAIADGTAGQFLIMNSTPVPAWGNTSTGNLSLVSSTSGVTRFLEVTQLSNAVGSQAYILSQVSGNLSGDAYFRATNAGVLDWAWGLDNSDSSAWVLSKATTLGTSNAIRVDPSTLAITLGTALGVPSGGTGAVTLAANTLLQGNTTGAISPSNTLAADFTSTTAAANTTRVLTVSSTSNTSSSGAVVQTSCAGTTSTACYHRFSIGSSRSVAMGVIPSSGNFGLATGGAAGTLPNSDTIIMTADTNGQVIWPNNCNFFSYVSTNPTNQTGDNTLVTIPFSNTLWDLNANISTTTFTAPATGHYNIKICIAMGGIISTHTTYVLSLVTTARTYQVLSGHPFNQANAGGNLIISASTLASFTAGDTATVTIVVSGGTKVVGFLGLTGSTQRTFWSGELVG